MGNTFHFDFEPALIEWLQNMMGTIGMYIASLFTMFGEELLLIVVIGFLYWCYDKELTKEIGTGIVVAMVWNAFIKNITLRRRPYFDHEGIKCLKAVDSSADIYDVAAQGYSFPSGHAMNSSTIYWSITRKLDSAPKWLKTVFTILPFLVGISRVALGVHYPTDVLAGWGIGLAIVLFLPNLEQKVNKRWKLHLAIFLISSIGILFCKTEDYYTSLGVMAGFFLAIPFEERFVKFSGTKEPLKIALRLLGGAGIYFALNTLLKLPFDEAFLASPVTAAFIVRSIRYAIIMFVVMGVYPMLFRKEENGK